MAPRCSSPTAFQVKIYAYKMSDTTRVTGKEFSLDSDNSSPQGLSCDGAHIWVADQTNSHTTSKIFVYEKDGTRASSLDLPAGTLSPSNNDGSVNNHDQRGMWSNGTTLFVVDQADSQVYAYQLSDRTRDDDKNLDLDAANTDPEGPVVRRPGACGWWTTSTTSSTSTTCRGAQPGNTPAEGRPAVRTPTSEQVLSATLTVGTGASPNVGNGYVTSVTTDTGSLSTTTFTTQGTTYTVVDLYDNSANANEGSLVLQLNQEIPSHFTISVDGTDYASNAARRDDLTSAFQYTWHEDLSWSDGETIAIALNVDAVPADGVELRADTSGITDDTDGLSNVYHHYQWIRVDGTDVTELDGETGPTYTATADDVTKDIQVRVIFDDDLRNREYPRYSPQVTVREVPPVVTGVALTSDPGGDDTYAIEDSVTATVTFDKAVDVTAGPQLTLLVGTADEAADCAAATNTTTMECSYEVAANDTAPDGVGIKANTLTLNGGTIYATGSTTNAATLTHSAQSLQSGHKVDGIRPTLVTTGNDAPKSSTDGTEIILTFNETISAVNRSKITVKESGTTTLNTTSALGGTNEVVTLILASALLSTSGTITVELDAEAVVDVPGNRNLAQSSTSVLVNLQATPWPRPT